ncbi:MAG: LytR C-terminal domain-containing protein [Bifidobacteriaceae bacterium]|nr:LytR C-terminal domain-containing protein [Bifidobacteriaceae bacterium]
MSKSAYPYPPDEFDQVDINSRPKEVHAARRGAWSRVWPFLLVIVLVPSVAFLAVHFLADRDPGSSSSPPPSITPSVDPTPDTPSEPPVTDPTPDTPPPVSEEPEPPPSAEVPVADKAAKVTVYNDGQTSGAAATAADALKTGGYANADKAFPPNPSNPQASTVYYSTDAQRVTADDVAAVLSITNVELNPQVAGGDIVVVVK